MQLLEGGHVKAIHISDAQASRIFWLADFVPRDPMNFASFSVVAPPETSDDLVEVVGDRGSR